VLGGKGLGEAAHSPDGPQRQREPEETQTEEEDAPLEGVGVHDGLEAAQRGVGHDDQRHAGHRLEHGHLESGGRQGGPGEDLRPGEAGVPDRGDDGRKEAGGLAKAVPQERGKGTVSQGRAQGLDPGQQEHRRQPGAEQPREQ